jgi:hypothetical protein
MQLSQRTILPEHTITKAASLPSLSENNCSSHSEGEVRRLAVRWVLSYCRKVARDTQYLAISYLNGLQTRGVTLTHDNYEAIAAATLLIASKMNEIYPPKITALLSRCKNTVTKEEIIAIEARIVSAFDYDIAFPNTTYTLIANLLGQLHRDKMEECEKLLRMVAGNREVYLFGEQVLAYAVIYLIMPQFVRDLQLQEAPKVKSVAMKVYSLYQQSKLAHQREKENQPSNCPS